MRFVVVEIPDNDEADNFVRALEAGQVVVSYQVRNEEDGSTSFGYRPIGEVKAPQVYAVPTMFCECAINYSQARSKKYGWYVCVKCSKPRKGSMQHPFNLRELDVAIKERVYYMGFRADRQGWRIPLLPGGERR